MGQAVFLVVESTFRPMNVFDPQTGQTRRVSKRFDPGFEEDGQGNSRPIVFVCDEEEAPLHALSRALKPHNDAAKNAVPKARERKARLDAEKAQEARGPDAEALRNREELAEARKDLRAALEAIRAKK